MVLGTLGEAEWGFFSRSGRLGLFAGDRDFAGECNGAAATDGLMPASWLLLLLLLLLAGCDAVVLEGR